MKAVEQRNAAIEFAEYWKDRGYEKGESQKFWLSLLRDIFGVEHPEQYIDFEDKVHLDHTSFIDGMIPSTKVMIEQKSAEKDLNKKIKQSDGSYLTPFQQAKKYITELPLSKHPRWIVTCNFKEFLIYDMENPSLEPQQLLLQDLPDEFHRLSFLVDNDNVHIKKEKDISVEAGKIVGHIYDALLKQYTNPKSLETQRSLNMLCVRIVFCLYAEDAGIFGKHKMFHDYMLQFNVNNWRSGLIELFRVLDTKIEDRSEYLSDDLAAFPYVNGGLFEDESIEVPKITDEIIYMILTYGSEQFDWSKISPTIFGAVFESTLNPETRRKGGMHYTSVENIHKVIDPLFLDELWEEFAEIKKYKYSKVVEKRLISLQEKMAKLKFLDPACGSGNFLTESYISLRRLENQIIQIMSAMKNTSGQIMFGDFKETNPIKVSISQFYGIEINDFAVTVAKTALWIAESQMMKDTEDIVHMDLDFLPLKTNAYIVEGNALRLDWEEVIKKEELNYIMGNPPFVGARYMDPRQKEDVFRIFSGVKNAGNLDYVAAWYKKAADYIENTDISIAYVSTNSITQGEQPAILWKELLETGIHIDFAYKTFIWGSEARDKAAVHCVIIGFSKRKVNPRRYIYDSEKDREIVKNINPYLIDADNIYITSRNYPICNVPEIGIGNKPIDGGFYLFTPKEKESFIEKEPESLKYFKPWYGAEEFINKKIRYCLWLGDCMPHEIRKMPECMKRVEAVKQFRLASKSAGTVKLAEKPTHFHVENMPQTNYILIPRVSSEKRSYVPMGFMAAETLCSDAAFILPDAQLYHFGVLMSGVHMGWMRAITGRLKSDYRYSKDIVYNNFPWCNPSEDQKAKIEQTAQAILDARALYPDCSLAELYDDTVMPIELRKAHARNDDAVKEAYGFSKDISEEKCVSELFKLYQNLVNTVMKC